MSYPKPFHFQLRKIRFSVLVRTLLAASDRNTIITSSSGKGNLLVHVTEGNWWIGFRYSCIQVYSLSFVTFEVLVLCSPTARELFWKEVITTNSHMFPDKREFLLPESWCEIPAQDTDCPGSTHVGQLLWSLWLPWFHSHSYTLASDCGQEHWTELGHVLLWRSWVDRVSWLAVLLEPLKVGKGHSLQGKGYCC